MDRRTRIANAREIANAARAACIGGNALQRRTAVLNALHENGYGDIALFEIDPPRGRNDLTVGRPVGYNSWGRFAQRRYDETHRS